ncbi:MAG: cysteine desulfurase / selenocysteine lyase [Thermoleophilaceae bacterium]|jgi:cysteine desulfurase/selenocysteine lyase|nr:cysteine desulfurase / selenocysteine lyase [Thermoleophilaceae bacterium]
MATTTSLDVRADFPILAGDIAYLDSAATSQKPEAVIEAISDYYRTSNANIHRSVYELAVKATEAYEGARERVAEFVGWDTATTIFTANASAAINLVAYAWARYELKPGDEILLTEMDHHSNIVPWQLAAHDTGAKLRYLHVQPDGTLSLDELDEELARGTIKLVAAVHVSNVLGTLNPVAEIAARARAAGAVSLIDGSQAVPQMPVNIADIGCDFYAWTGHKALGPTGIGVLHGRRELLESMRPFIGGGHMISMVGEQESTWNELPWKYEAGTSPIAEAVGLDAAVKYLQAIGMDTVRAHEAELTAYALERLPEVPGLTLFGPLDLDKRGGTVSFALEGLHPHDVAELLGRENVCIRAGHHCAQPLMRHLGVPATARASFHVYNSRQDIDKLIDALHSARKVFQL